jgi:hypothetical protein
LGSEAGACSTILLRWAFRREIKSKINYSQKSINDGIHDVINWMVKN